MMVTQRGGDVDETMMLYLLHNNRLGFTVEWVLICRVCEPDSSFDSV